MTPDALVETLHEIIEDLTRKGRQRPLFFACIAADGGTMTGSSGFDGRVVVGHPGREELPLPIHILVVDTRASAQHVAIAHANETEDAGSVSFRAPLVSPGSWCRLTPPKGG
jgi:hypothetical protein